MPRSLHSYTIFLLSMLMMSSPIFSDKVSSESMWKGRYIGGFLGGGFGKYQIQTRVGTPKDNAYFSSQVDINSVNQTGTGSANPQSFLVGLKLGDDWIWHKMVWGAVIDYGTFRQKSTLNASSNYPDSSDIYSIPATLKTDWLFTLRARSGVTFDYILPGLLYATGGMALTKMTASSQFSDSTLLSGLGTSILSANQIGWTAGAGLEFAVHPHFFITAEYLYTAFPNLATQGTITNSADGFGVPLEGFTSPFSTKVTLTTNLFRIGVNYRLTD